MSLTKNDAATIASLNSNDSREALRAIVWRNDKKHGKPPLRAKVTSIDGKGVTIEYVVVKDLLRNPSGNKQSLSASFKNEVKTASDARRAINQLAREAIRQKASTSQSITYSMPRDFPIWIGLNLFLLFVSRPDLFDAVASRSPVSLAPIDAAFSFVRSRLPNGAQSMLWLYKWVLLAHAGEASLMAGYSWYRGARGLTWIQWVLTHFTVGFTTFANFLKVNPTVPKF